LTNRPSARRLALAVTLALSLSAFAVALFGPAQTLAEAHKASCPSTVHAKAKHGLHGCTQPSHKTKRHAKHTSKKKARKRTHGASQATVPAHCEDGSAPVRAGDGSFACDDGSEPECEDGATPKASRSGKSLVCLVASEGAASTNEAECEEEDLSCSAGSESGEQACEAPAGEDSSPACEGEG
jgi:hypothetical protein